LNTLNEVADSIPTLYTLICECTTHHSATDEVLIVSCTDSNADNDDVDLPAPYPAEDQYDTFETVISNSASYAAAKCRRVAVKASKIKTNGKASHNIVKPETVLLRSIKSLLFVHMMTSMIRCW